MERKQLISSILRNYLNESNNQDYLNKEENQSLKLIYITIRDILLDLKKQISIYYQQNQGNISISNFLKTNYKAPQNIKVSNQDNTLILNFDQINPIIKKTFPALQKEFFITLKIKDEGAAIKSQTQPLRINGLEIGTTKLFNYPEQALKSSLQHEIQHIANLHKEGITNDDYSDDSIVYLASAKEVDSHAKQFAYLYAKNYPQDKTIDVKKLQTIDMVKRSKDKLNLYLWFLSPDQFRKQNNLSDEVYNKVKLAGQEFAKKMKYYLTVFTNKS